MSFSAPAAGSIRPPAIAGTFYPGDSAVLGSRVADLLRQATGLATEHGAAAPVGLVVPHAGIAYSGAVAAAGWASLQGAPPDTVVIAGTNHFAAGLRGIAVWPDGAWRTPLGEVQVDGDLSDRIVALGRPFVIDREAHLEEHSIEVQLPFLALACPSSRLVPLLVACASVQACVAAGDALGGLLAEVRAEGSSVALVASSDFAHYPDERDARDVNRRLVPLISALDPDAVAAEEDAIRRSRVRGLSCGLCGLEPVLFALGAFRAMGLAPGRLLAEATSADVPGGDPFRTVGYATIAFGSAG